MQLSDQKVNIQERWNRNYLDNMGGGLWSALPKHVANLELGPDVNIARNEEELRLIPLVKRENWNLQRVDEYAGRLSASIMQQWRPIFPQEMK
jgi:hypothetical protein